MSLQEQKSNCLKYLLERYPSVMELKIYVNSEDEYLKNKYVESSQSHNKQLIENPFVNAGFDLYVPEDFSSEGKKIIKLDHKIRCSAQIHTNTSLTYNTGFYLYPRSSISNTQYRLANSVGIIDSGYRGNIIAALDSIYLNINEKTKQGTRLCQICAPSLMPIIVEIVDNENELGVKTSRGDGGFGSTGL